MRYIISGIFLLHVAILLSLYFMFFCLKHLKISSKSLFNNAIEINKTDYNENKSSSELKYILEWTSGDYNLFYNTGQEIFIKSNCTYTNCFIAQNRSYLGSIESFDVIAFGAVAVVYYNNIYLPGRRSPHQKYVLTSLESSFRYPICSDYLNNFFNWTWTYKTNSDARWDYITIYDSNDIFIGPNAIMHWMKLEDMKPVGDELKEKLKSKKKAVAWFVSKCYAANKRERFVNKIQNELIKYKLYIDIYGKCGPLNCTRNNHEKCLKMLEKDYYFYLSFENSFAGDYVTEKLLHALQHNTVPIVYGGANYTRFMPDGIYLNAREMGIGRLAKKIHELILNPDKYAEYFKWQNHYSYYTRSKYSENNTFCNFCAMLNDEQLVNKVSIYDMKKWWNPPNQCSMINYVNYNVQPSR